MRWRKWTTRMVAADGTLLHERRFWTRQAALRHGWAMQTRPLNRFEIVRDGDER